MVVGNGRGHRGRILRRLNETFLNVRGSDAVIEAVRRCWASLFGARTIFDRAKRGFGQADMDIAVVVQRQIASERAGVMFTVDPASGAADRLVTEASFGLGDAVVSGRVSPDRYVVDKRTLALRVRAIHPKEAVIEPLPAGGTTTRELSHDEAIRSALTDDEVRSIAERRMLVVAARGQLAGRHDLPSAFSSGRRVAG